MGINLTPEERFEVFGDFNPDDHAAEVEERRGGTEAVQGVAAPRGALHESRLAADQGTRARPGDRAVSRGL